MCVYIFLIINRYLIFQLFHDAWGNNLCWPSWTSCITMNMKYAREKSLLLKLL